MIVLLAEEWVVAIAGGDTDTTDVVDLQLSPACAAVPPPVHWILSMMASR